MEKTFKERIKELHDEVEKKWATKAKLSMELTMEKRQLKKEKEALFDTLTQTKTQLSRKKAIIKNMRKAHNNRM